MRLATAVAWILLAAATTAQMPEAERTAEIAVRCRVGFAGFVPIRGLWPLILEFTNRTKSAVEIEVEIDGAHVGADEKLTIKRRMIVSPETARRFELIESGAGLLLRRVTLRTAAAHDWFVAVSRSTAVSESAKQEIGFPLARDANGEVVAVCPVIGGRAQQTAAALPRNYTNRMVGAFECAVAGSPGAVAPLVESELPESPLAWSDCEAVVWTEPDPSAVTPAALAALLDWVASGGRLILVSAHRSDRMRDDALARLLPGRLEYTEMRTYGQFTRVLRADAVRGMALGFAAVPEARAQNPAKAIVWPEKLPVRYERRFGMGRVVTTAVDPFAYDRGDPAEFVDAFSGITGVSVGYLDVRERNAPSGVPAFLGDVVAEILANGISTKPPLGPFFLLALVYVWLIGKFDFELLTKKKRLRWSPVTLLVYAGAFAILCVSISGFLFSSRAAANRIAVADFYVDHDGRDRVNAHVYDGVFAPHGGRFSSAPLGDYDYYAAPAVHDTGLAFGERSPEMQDLDGPGRQAYRPILPVNSFRTIETRANGTPTGMIDVKVEASDEELFIWRVTVRNGLSRPITNGLFIWNGGFVPCPDIPAGESYSTLAGMPMSDPKAMPGGETDLLPDVKGAGVRWDQVIDVVRKDGTPDRDLVCALRSLSMKAWCARMKGLVEAPKMPWDLASRLDQETAMFWGLTDEMVIPDERPRENRGYTHVVVRRLVPLPRVGR